MFFFHCYYINFQNVRLFFDFLVSIIDYYRINRLHLFGDSFEWSCLQMSGDAKYFFLSCPRLCDQGSIAVIVYYFQIWNKKEPNIIIRMVISSHLGPMYSETSFSSFIYEAVIRCGNEWQSLVVQVEIREYFRVQACTFFDTRGINSYLGGSFPLSRSYGLSYSTVPGHKIPN